jgi:hypothetical protein
MSRMACQHLFAATCTFELHSGISLSVKGLIHVLK